MIDYLYQAAEEYGIHLTDEMLNKFDIFYEKLMETNQTMNLTAITEMKDVVLKHFIDSMAISNYYDLSGSKVIDVGTGAGFPGIPLAILFPEAKFVLLDSLKKRLNFINAIVYLCGLNNVEIIHGRAEDFGVDKKYREHFDFCVSRAVAYLPVLLELCIPFVKVGGKFISYKSESLDEEINESEHAMQVLSCNLVDKQEYQIPYTDFYRVYAVIEKTQETNEKYPRQAGKPKRNPL